jgi:hypothetical protein
VTPSLETDARVACVRHGEPDRVTACAMVDGFLLASEGQILLQAIRRVSFAAFTQREETEVIECSDPAETLALTDHIKRSAGALAPAV